MTLDRDFDRIASAWLADGPTELSDRVLDAVVDQVHLTRQRRAVRAPWRFPTMSMPARVAALVAVGVLAIAGVVALSGVGGQSKTTPTPTRSTSVTPTGNGNLAAALPALDTTFTSDWHGYSVKYPAGWRATPADRAWPAGTRPQWGDPTLDEIKSSTIRFNGTQQIYAQGQTPQQWLLAYCQANGQADCPSVVASWRPFKVAGQDAYLDADGVKAAANSVSADGLLYEAVVTLSNRAYVLTMDGRIDRSVFDAFLNTITLVPGNAVDTPPLTETYSSPTYGYTVGKLPTWPTRDATTTWTGADDETPSMDNIDITGTDTSFSGASQQLGSQTYDAFLAAFHASTQKNVPPECDGGDPATWRSIQVGDQTGSLEMLCNAAEALVHVGDRVYVFDWGNSTFDTNQHFSFVAWEAMLRTVRFQPWTANLSKTFTSPTYGYSIAIEPNWTTTPSTKAWRDTGNSSDFMDGIDITGANLGIGAMSQKLNGRTFDQFVQQFYEGQLAAIGPSCVGGEPSTWDDVQIGAKTGKLEIQCGTDEALVQAGDRVYLFEIGNSASAPLWSLDSWKTVLRGVTLDPASAKT